MIAKSNLLLRAFAIVSVATVLTLSLAANPSAGRPHTMPPEADATTFFESKVRPVLFEKCFSCHGEKKQQAGVRLDSRANILKEALSGPIVVPGEPDKSALVRAIRYDGKTKMPPTGKLSAADLAALTDWVKMGAPWPEPKSATTVASKNYWAFRPLTKTTIPNVKSKSWMKTPVDAFILSELERRNLKPNPYADRPTLIRRATFDLIGLPPTPEEVDAFVNDKSPPAWEKVIDRLLQSPHYGERWGRHWLDLARFAESHGYEQDYDRPNAYYYRDFVIKALNLDVPYNTFVKWQLAGDEFEPENPLALMATGFLAAGTHATQITKNQVEKERYDELDDMLATTGTSMLGLTFGCARCHDHKFDPVPQRDYYRMLATFTTTVRSDYEIDLDPQGYREAKDAFDKAQAPLAEALQEFERGELPARFDRWLNNGRKLAANVKVADNVKDLLAKSELTSDDRAALMKWYATTDAQRQALNKQVQDHLANEPKKPKVLISSEGVTAVRTHTQGGDFLEGTHFLRRGDPNRKEGVATQSFLTVLMRAPEQEKRWQIPPPQGWRTSYQRRSFANWITDTDAGAGHLLARVIVNRLWQHHLGRGLVGTPSDFGAQGEKPSHPELLDYLATQLINHGWSLKHMHKLIMTSAVYLQSAASDPAKEKLDPQNKLCGKHPRQRLEAEVIRDSMLALSGRLDPTKFGPGTLDETMKRRSIYFFVKRSKLIPTMMLFDAPNALTGMAVRPTTTVAPQALMLLNNQNVRECARAFAQRVASVHPSLTGKGGGGLGAVVARAYRTAFGRQPTDKELADSLTFLAQQSSSYKTAEGANADELALTDFCQVLFGLNEFVYVE